MASVDPVRGAAENHGQGREFQVNKAPRTETGLLSLPRVTLMAAKGHSLEEPQGKENRCSSCPGEQRKGQRGPERAGSRSASWGCRTPRPPRGAGTGVHSPPALAAGSPRWRGQQDRLDLKALREDPPAAPGAALPQPRLRLLQAFSPVCLSSSVQQGHQSLDLGPTWIIQGALSRDLKLGYIYKEPFSKKVHIYKHGG